MKNSRIATLIFCIALLGACEDPLGLKKTNTWADETVWALPKAAEGVLIKAYQATAGLPDSFGDNFLDAATDNAITNNRSSSAWLAGNGGFSRTNNVIGNWSQCYNQFQYIHEFLLKGLTEATLYNRVDPVKDAAIKSKLEGEVYFLRAWWGFQFLQKHGGRADNGKALGYPIVTKFIDKESANDPELFVRNTYEQCVTQILEDCDKAITLLPDVYNGVVGDPNGKDNIGRGTSTAAAILKSTVTLYAASPAYQDREVVRIDGMGSYTVLDPLTVQSKWERAALTADKALKLTGFGTFYGIKSSDLSLAPAVTPGEFVFRRYNNSNSMEMRHNPPFNYGSAQTVPSNNLMEAFPAKNGFPITDVRSLYNPADPYALARDNRMLLNIYHHGRVYNSDLGAIDVVAGGKDSPYFSPYASSTGYYLAKFIANTTVNYEKKTNFVHYYPYIRKAEAFLNYAEAANEAWGPTVKDPSCTYTAYDVIKMIREKSGGITDTQYLDEMAATKEDFRKLIQNERRLELSFENHRFFDMRRWLLPLNETVMGMEVTRASGVLTYRSISVQQRPMNEVKYYFIPVPESELLKNPNLLNNIGW